MPKPKLPVIYAVLEEDTNSLVTACESNKDAELNASAQHRMSENREYRIIAYPPPPESPPVPRDETQDMWVFEDGGDSIGAVEYNGQDKDRDEYEEGERYVRFADLEDALRRVAQPIESPPREYWRLLGPAEKILATDESLNPFAMKWHRMFPCFVDLLAGNYDRPVRRRVSPPPTCATCSCFYTSNCTHPDGPSNVPGDGYCYLHPQAQAQQTPKATGITSFSCARGDHSACGEQDLDAGCDCECHQAQEETNV